MADLVEVLTAASQANQQAEDALKQMEAANRPEFAVSLAKVLATEGVPVPTRQLAGLLFKSLLAGQSESVRADKLDQWKRMDPAVRTACKEPLLQALQSPEPDVRAAAAQAVAHVAAVELPFGEWPGVVPTLMGLISSASTMDAVKVACLTCLGFTCERIAELGQSDMPEDTTNAMLTAIVDGMQATRSDEMRAAAATALRDSLLFSQSNMERKPERDAIMHQVHDAAKAGNAKVRLAAYTCLVQLATVYYDKLVDYMTALYQLTVQTIENDEEEVAVQALEFWSSICEEEMNLMDEAADLVAQNLPVERQSNNFVASAVQHLVPILLGTMTKQDENADEEDENYNLSSAGAMCLKLVAQTVENSVVPSVMPFVTQNIQNNENWRYKEAAIMAFAAVLEGPAPESMRGAVADSIPVLLEAMSNEHALVRESAAYAIAQICDLHAESMPPQTLPALVNTLMERTTREPPRAAYQSCSAIHKLAEAIGRNSQPDARTNALSPFLPALLQAMLQVVDRPDADEHSLRPTAMETVTIMIDASATDMKPVLLQLLPVIVERLKASFSIPALTNEERLKKESYQGHLCGSVQVLCIKLTNEEFLEYSDACMAIFLQILQSKNSTSHEEVFNAISSLIDKQEAGFEKYMPAFQPFLIAGLQNYEAFQVCRTAVSVVGDITRAIENKIQPYCQDIMSALVHTLREASVHRDVKPPVFMAFGDVAMAIEAAFEPYVQISMMFLMQASNVEVTDDDEELIEYLNELREGILEGFTGIVTGLRDGQRLDLIVPYVSHILNFLQKVESDPNRDNTVLGKAVGLLGDVAASLGAQVKDEISKPYAVGLITAGRQTGDENIVASANWAGGVIQQIVQSH